MEIFLAVVVSFIAGAGAGLGTGFAGMSAAVVIAPMLTVFLGVDPYAAVAIALASDVLASAVSAYTYGRHKNIDIKNGSLMLAVVLVFTVVGSYVASLIPAGAMGNISLIFTVILGMKFILKPVMTTKENMLEVSRARRIIGSILCGILVGFICGFVGAGGGIMMLLILTSLLGYELKTAVGTSVFIMTFTALIGAGTHFVFILTSGMPDWHLWLILGLCVVFTFAWARVAAVIANKVEPKVLNVTLGVILEVLGIIMMVFNIIKFYVW